MPKQNYFVNQNNDFILNLTFKTGNTPIDIAGYTILLTAKTDKGISDSDPSVIKATGVITDHANGLATVTIPASVLQTISGTYYYQVDYIAPSADPITFQYGVITFKQATTTRSS
jgi:hypothetical protein